MTLLLPWSSWRQEWEVRLDEVVLDGRERNDVASADHRRLDLSEPWESATVRVTAVPADSERPDGISGLMVHALVTCRDTLWRAPVVLAPQEDGSWLGRVELSSDVLAGTVEITATATATVDGSRRLVGLGTAWRVVVDPGDAPRPSGAPPFRTVWTAFRGDDAPADVRGAPDSYAVVAAHADELVLYLNSGIEGLQDLLHADRARGPRRMVRELVGSEVARQALASVVRAAAGEVVEMSDEDTVSPPTERIYRQALDAVARAMPEVAGLDELVERIAAAEHGPSATRFALWAEIDAAVAQLAGTTAAVSDAAKEVRFV